VIDIISSIVGIITTVLCWIIFVYFVYTVSYSLILSIAAFFYRSPLSNQQSSARKIVVLIPAYKEDGVIVEAAQQAINHDYPEDRFDVVVIADSLQKKTLDQLVQLQRLIVVEVDFKISTKVKALNEALSKIDKSYDIGIILDADNIMDEGFLTSVSSCYDKGYFAIQGQRVAKNKNTSMALLDALSEAINNHIYRQGTSALGLSCSFIGSGIAVDFDLMNETLDQMDSVGGFDRDMEVRLIGKGYKVQYLKSAVVLDEKVENTKVFANQRKRWIYSQYNYLFKELKPGLKKLLRGDFVYFNSAVLRNIQLPRLINLGLLFIVMVLSFVFPNLMGFSYFVWLSLLLLLVLSNLIAIPRSFIGKDLIGAILSLPKVFIIMFLLLFKLRGANKFFIHTPHNKLSK
jgi:cellulose synthase/poly-beta-1,6-N-acetylglucosamine synthase-like glycosyltransferase